MCLYNTESQTLTVGVCSKVKVYFQDSARRMGSSYSKDPNFPMAFREEFLKATFGVRVAGGMTFFWMIFQES